MDHDISRYRVIDGKTIYIGQPAGEAEVSTPRTVQKAHVKGHIRVIEGKTVWVTDHEDKRKGRAAKLHERTALGEHKEKGHYLRATDADDAATIRKTIERMDAGVTRAQSWKGQANHLGHVDTYEHFKVDSPEHGARILAELAQAPEEPEPIQQGLFSEEPQFQDGETLPFKNVGTFLDQHVYGHPKGEAVPNPTFEVGQISPEGIAKIKPFIEGFDDRHATVRVSGRALKHAGEGHDNALRMVVDKLPEIMANPAEVLHNPKRPNSAFVVYRAKPNAMIVIELSKNGTGTDIVNVFDKPDRKMNGPRSRSAEWLEGRQPALIPSPEPGSAVGAISDVQPSGIPNIIPSGESDKGQEGPKDGDRNEDGLVFHDGRWHREEELGPTEPVTVAEAQPAPGFAIPPPPVKPRKVSEDPDDPNSPNYRYRDTGYVAGSRKELAAEMIRRAGRDGQQVTAHSIDWESIEKNPREAKELITKSNLFGTVDWETLKADGMEPGAGFLVDRIYAAIGKEPSEDNPQARHDYAVGLESLRARLEACRTPDQVSKIVDELREEWEGITLSGEEAEAYQAVQARKSALFEKKHAFDQEDEALAAVWQTARHARTSALYEQEKRKRRNWKPDPELDASISKLEAQEEEASKARETFRDANPFFKREYKSADALDLGRFDSPYDQEQATLSHVRNGILAMAKARNLAENPVHRALNVMGKRFTDLLNYRRHSGSEAFANHVATAKAGKIKDWSWAEKEHASPAPKATKQSIGFQLQVADKFERIGGRAMKPDSTEAVKRTFGLHEVQSGNYVLNDANAAKFHVEQSAAAFADLADLMGIPDGKVGLQGKLSMAYGARGTGNAGWRGAAAAQYSPTYRIINVTKLRGGSCLAHEWFHALDNLMVEAETGQTTPADTYAIERPDLLPEGELKSAAKALSAALWDGNHQVTSPLAYTAKDHQLAQHNLTGSAAERGLRKEILDAGSLEGAVAAIDRKFPVKDKDAMKTADKFERSRNRKNAKERDGWRTLVAAWYGGNPEGGSVEVPISRPMSSYAYEAHILDEGKTPYWSTTRELAARAFHAWTEDRLADQGRKNDYLAAKGDNKFYNDPFFGPRKPYPEGEERQRINAAFDRLVAALKQQRTIEKAMKRMERL